jgi:hypothetical protein
MRNVWAAVCAVLVCFAGFCYGQRTSRCPVVNATNLCITDPPYSADASGAADSTSAFRTAIAALAKTGGHIWVPDGNYTVDGTLQDPQGANAVLPMPRLLNYQTPLLDIYIEGFTRPSWAGNVMSSITTNLMSGNLFGGYDGDHNNDSAAGDFPGFTNVKLHLANLRLKLPANTGATAVDASYLLALDVQHVLLNAGDKPSTNPANWGIKFPSLGNEVQNFLDDVQIGGYYNDYLLTEHTRVGSIYAANGVKCFVFDSGPNAPGKNNVPGTYMGNSINVQYLWGMNCTNAIVGGLHRTTINVQTADIELPGTYGISDPLDSLYGVIGMHNPYVPFNVTPVQGGTNLRIVPLDGTPAPVSVTAVSAAVTPRFVKLILDGQSAKLPFNDEHFTVNATVTQTLEFKTPILSVTFGHKWNTVPHCQVTPRQDDSTAMAMVGTAFIKGTFYLVPLSTGLPAARYTWDVACTDR